MATFLVNSQRWLLFKPPDDGHLSDLVYFGYISADMSALFWSAIGQDIS